MSDWIQRPLTTADLLPAFRGISQGFGAPVDESPDVLEVEAGVLDLDRTFTTWDGAEFVGALFTLPRTVAVPGSTVPVAAVTGVAVAAPYRRQGVLSSLMRAAFDDAEAHGEAVASLFASEAGIYGRYGYAAAAPTARVSIDLARAGFGAWGAGLLNAFGGVLSEHCPTEVLPLMAPVLEKVAASRPGVMSRPAATWKRLLLDPATEREGYAEQRAVLARSASGEVLGFARFARRSAWENSLPTGSVHVRELMATTAPAEAALWRYLLDTDLAATLTAQDRPPSDLLTHLLADPRRRRVVLNEGLYVRVVSVPGALSTRVFSAPLDIVIEVADAFRPQGSGRWRVAVEGPDCFAAVTPTDAPADVRLPVTALGAAHLGTIRLGDCPGVQELTPGALVAATRAWAWHIAAWPNEPF